MAYKHRVSVTEQSTGLVTPVNVDSALPIYFGSSPKGRANTPKLIYTYAEAVEFFGYVGPNASGDFEYTLSEVINAHFSKFAVAPIVLVNVLDVANHKTSITDEDVTVADGKANIARGGILVDSVVVTGAVKGTDYELVFSDDGSLNILATENSALVNGNAKVSYDYADASKVLATDIIGGNAADGSYKGMELIDSIFPMFRKTAGLIAAPGFSSDPAVAGVMKSKAKAVSGMFKAQAVIDVDDSVRNYTEVAAWKNDNNIVDGHQIVCWPMVSLGGVKYHLSTQAVCVMMLTDAENGDNPHKSPSNESLQADSAILADGTEVWLTPTQAELLNGEGIVTALNFIGGWKLWGNRTAAYPANTDVKDAFIPVRRTFNWVGNTIIQTMWQKLDQPLNRRQIETIVDSENQWLNSLVATGALLGARVEFTPEENPDIQLLDGKSVFHIYLTPPTPNKEIEHILEYDISNFTTLFD